MVLLQILWNDILPLLFFMGCGWFLDSKFKMDISTYTKLTIYVVLPCFVFFSMYKYQPSPSDLAMLPAALLLLVLLFVLSRITSRFFTKNPRKQSDFSAISTFSNSGHLGAALIVLVFSHGPYLVDGKTPYLDEAMASMALLMIFMNILANTWGAALIRRQKESIGGFLHALLKMPVLYAALLAILIRSLGISLDHTFLYPVLHHFTGAFMVLVTITMGIQLHRTHRVRLNTFILGSAFLKLIFSPLLALLLLYLYGGFSPITSQVFLLYAAIPSSIMLVIYGAEYREHPALLTQSIIFNTLAGAFTLTGFIYLAAILFPVGL